MKTIPHTIIGLLTFLAVAIETPANEPVRTATGAQALPPAERHEWMKGKYGLMVHWLAPAQTPVRNGALVGPQPAKGAYRTDLNQAVDGFDLKGFMSDFDKTGAEWLIFTIGQNRGTYASPNRVIDTLCGPGHTSRRDLVLEIAKAVKQRNKRFIAYLPVELKANDSMKKGMEWIDDPRSDQAAFQTNYLKAIQEWSLRFGTDCDGWWFDGCYPHDRNHFSNKFMKWEQWYAATRAGNPNSVLAFNPGILAENCLMPIRPEHDYLAGETVVLIDGRIRLNRDNRNPVLFMPETALVPGTRCLYHSLLPIDVFWGHPNPWTASWLHAPESFLQPMPEKQDEMRPPVYPDKELQQFVNGFTKAGGAVTLNVGIFQEGRLGKNTIAQLQRLKESR